MELQFQKTPLPYLRMALRQAQTQEQTQEVRLPEEMPDIGNVIAGWGQVLVRGKEWRSGGIQISGGVMVWVLYTPEDGSQPCTLEAWLPFQMKWEFPDTEPDGKILACPLLQGVDARSTGARKIMVRTCVSMLAQAMCQDQADIYIPDALPEDVCVLQNTYPVCLPVEAGEKAFSLEETLPLPESMPAPAKLLRYSLCPQVTEQRLLGDKVIFRGAANVHILYCDGEGKLHSWDAQVPFSQYAELDRDVSDGAQAKVCMAVTNLELELSDGTLILKAGLLGQYTVRDCKEISLVEDAYSPARQIIPAFSQLQLPVILDTVEKQFAPACTVEEGQLLDAAFYPEHARVYHDQEGLTAELAGAFQTLCMNADGYLHGQMCRWEDSAVLPAGEQVRAQGMVTPLGVPEYAGSSINAAVQLDMQTISQGDMSMVTALELGQASEPDPDRPSLILCRAGSQGLWEVAKRTGSTVEAILKANDLQQAPMDDRMLLIPVP